MGSPNPRSIFCEARDAAICLASAPLDEWVDHLRKGQFEVIQPAVSPSAQAADAAPPGKALSSPRMSYLLANERISAASAR